MSARYADDPCICWSCPVHGLEAAEEPAAPPEPEPRCQCYPIDDNGGIDQRDCPLHDDDEPWGVDEGTYYGIGGAADPEALPEAAPEIQRSDDPNAHELPLRLNDDEWIPAAPPAAALPDPPAAPTDPVGDER